jgi:hypothetical protein
MNISKVEILKKPTVPEKYFEQNLKQYRTCQFEK